MNYRIGTIVFFAFAASCAPHTMDGPKLASPAVDAQQTILAREHLIGTTTSELAVVERELRRERPLAKQSLLTEQRRLKAKLKGIDEIFEAEQRIRKNTSAVSRVQSLAFYDDSASSSYVFPIRRDPQLTKTLIGSIENTEVRVSTFAWFPGSFAIATAVQLTVPGQTPQVTPKLTTSDFPYFLVHADHYTNIFSSFSCASAGGTLQANSTHSYEVGIPYTSFSQQFDQHNTTDTKSCAAWPRANVGLADTIGVGKTAAATTTCNSVNTTWTSGTPAVASVSSAGVVTGLMAGQSEITSVCPIGVPILSGSKVVTIVENPIDEVTVYYLCNGIFQDDPTGCNEEGGGGGSGGGGDGGEGGGGSGGGNTCVMVTLVDHWSESTYNEYTGEVNSVYLGTSVFYMPYSC